MASEASPAVASAAGPPPNSYLLSLPATVLHPHKSYRRKYRKIMVKFEQQMRESSALFKDQQRLYDISQRIAEQNDQILSLLLEVNSQPQIPNRLRYDLNDAAVVVKPEKHEDSERALELLRTARNKIFKGEIKQPEYEEIAQDLLNTVEFAPTQSYVDLLKGESLHRNYHDPMDGGHPMIGGFLSTKQEEQYLQSLDDFLDLKTMDARSHSTSNLGRRHPAGEKSTDREREFQLRNPVSVYNWLRKNQPQVFLQDADHEKVRGPPASRKSKREPAAARASKAGPDPYDEDGIAVEQSTGKGKRKRDEDGGYRPKGGHPRSAKRRKEDGGRKSKRPSMDTSAF